MIRISQHYSGFKMTFSAPGTGWRGDSVQARSLTEVHEAIDHYHGNNTPPHISERTETCPLCRMMVRESSKMKRTRREAGL